MNAFRGGRIISTVCLAHFRLYSTRLHSCYCGFKPNIEPKFCSFVCIHCRALSCKSGVFSDLWSDSGVLPWRNRQRVRLLTERSEVRTFPGAYSFVFFKGIFWSHYAAATSLLSLLVDLSYFWARERVKCAHRVMSARSRSVIEFRVARIHSNHSSVGRAEDCRVRSYP